MQPLHRRLSAHLFHRLGARELASARRAAAAGADLFCITIDSAVASQLGVAVRELGPEAIPDFSDAVVAPGAFDLAEKAAESLLARHGSLVRPLVSRHGSAELRCYVARWLYRSVGDLYALARLACSAELEEHERIVVDRHWPGGQDLAFLAELARREGVELPAATAAGLDRLSFTATEPSAFRRVAVALHGVLALWREWLPRARPSSSPLSARPLLLRHYGEDWGLDRGGQSRLRNFDFVVDGDTIRPADVAILAEETVPAECDGALRARGYEVVRVHELAFGPSAFARRILPRLVVDSLLVLRASLAERAWHEPMRMLVSQSLLWSEAGRTLRPRVFLAYNDLHPAGAARTLGLKRAGCRAVQYEYSSSWLFDEHGWTPDFVYAFVIADAVATWGPMHSRNLLDHRGVIGECWEVGCLWSEHARLVRDDPDLRSRYEGLLEQAVGAPLGDFRAAVGVFDSSVDPHLLDADEIVAFYADVLAAAAQLPGVLFLCKPKRPIEPLLSAARNGDAVRAALRDAGNVAVLDDLFETGAVIGLTSLAINACFTSTAVEAIGMGHAALYHDATDRFRRAFFRLTPGLVTTGVEELAACIGELLELPESAVPEDLRARLSELEGHFDGRAITRLRERLATVMRG